MALAVIRPPNFAVAFLMMFILYASFMYIRRNNLMFLYNKQMWAICALYLCYASVSGQMFNQIRRPIFIHWSKNGPVFMTRGYRGSQFVLESYIVAIFMSDSLVVAGMILMIEAAGGVKNTEIIRTQVQGKHRRLQLIVGLVLVAIFFSLLLSFFRFKMGVYPYRFLFK